MKRVFKCGLGMSLALIVVVVLLMGLRDRPDLARAEAITYYATSTFFGGGTGYTATATSAGVDVAPYGTVQLQVHKVVSGTGVYTVTPQFSVEPGSCANARYWYTATEYRVVESLTNYADEVTMTTGTVRITQTVTPALLEISRSHQFVVASGDSDVAQVLPVYGSCMRVIVASSSSRFTPTVYVRAVDLYE